MLYYKKKASYTATFESKVCTPSISHWKCCQQNFLCNSHENKIVNVFLNFESYEKIFIFF